MSGHFTILSSVDEARPEWLWEGRIPLGAVTVLDGDPGSGKSAVTYDLAARVSCGGTMPDGTPCGAPGGVVLLQAEDDVATRLVPALSAAGAVRARILASRQDSEHPLTLPSAMAALESAVDEVNATLVVLDPLSAYLETNTHHNQSVRRALGPLAALAKRRRLAVLVVRHLAKRGGGNPLYRGLGSIGIIGMARSALAVGKSTNVEAPHRYVLALAKSNLSSCPSLQYRTVLTDGTITVDWLGEIDCSAEQFAERRAEKTRAITEAKQVLLAILSDGPVLSKQVVAAAKDAGVSKRTLDRAKYELDVSSDRQGNGLGAEWYWLPPGIRKLTEWHLSSGVATPTP